MSGNVIENVDNWLHLAIIAMIAVTRWLFLTVVVVLLARLIMLFVGLMCWTVT